MIIDTQKELAKHKRNKAKRYFIDRCVRKLKYQAGHYELIFKALLDMLSIKYEFQKLLWGNKIVDFYLPDYRVVIEIDGGYHKTLKQKDKDLRRDTDFCLGRIKVIRFTNQEVLDKSHIVNRLDKEIKLWGG